MTRVFTSSSVLVPALTLVSTDRWVTKAATRKHTSTSSRRTCFRWRGSMWEEVATESKFCFLLCGALGDKSVSNRLLPLQLPSYFLISFVFYRNSSELRQSEVEFVGKQSNVDWRRRWWASPSLPRVLWRHHTPPRKPYTSVPSRNKRQ